MATLADSLEIPKDAGGLIWFMLDALDGLRHREGRVPVEDQFYLWSAVRDRILELNIDPGSYKVCYVYPEDKHV